MPFNPLKLMDMLTTTRRGARFWDFLADREFTRLNEELKKEAEDVAAQTLADNKALIDQGNYDVAQWAYETLGPQAAEQAYSGYGAGRRPDYRADISGLQPAEGDWQEFFDQLPAGERAILAGLGIVNQFVPGLPGEPLKKAIGGAIGKKVDERFQEWSREKYGESNLAKADLDTIRATFGQDVTDVHLSPFLESKGLTLHDLATDQDVANDFIAFVNTNRAVPEQTPDEIRAGEDESLLAEFKALGKEVIDIIDFSGATQHKETDEAYDRLYASGYADMVSRGISGSSIATNWRSSTEKGRTAAHNEINTNMSQAKANWTWTTGAAALEFEDRARLQLLTASSNWILTSIQNIANYGVQALNTISNTIIAQPQSMVATVEAMKAAEEAKKAQEGSSAGSWLGLGTGTAGGAGMGAIIGSIVPGVGTAVGALIGGSMGALSGGAGVLSHYYGPEAGAGLQSTANMLPYLYGTYGGGGAVPLRGSNPIGRWPTATGQAPSPWQPATFSP